MKIKVIIVVFVLFFNFIIFSASAWAQDLSVISFNVESDDDTRAEKVALDIKKIVGADLWGLSEVAGEEDADILAEAASYPGAAMTYILGSTGINQPARLDDRLLIMFNRNRLELIDAYELEGSGGSREPLVAEFKLLPENEKLLFVVNHFNRREAERREKQAQFLVDWASEQSLPIIAVGDYNFDVDPNTKEGNQAKDIFFAEDVFKWIQPDCVKNGSCPTTGTQCNPQFNSILDFVFVANSAKKWQANSEILFSEEAYCEWDEIGYADHRPVKATFVID